MDATTRGPLDQQHRITVEAIAYAEVIELARIGEAIEVEVMDGPARDVVELEQGICRAHDRAEITHEIKYRRARRAGARKRGARGEHGLFAGDQPMHGGGLAHCRSAGIRSLATRPRWPPSAAVSPARACRCTPSHADWVSGIPCAASPAMTPVNTSPMPPLAVPGLAASRTRTTSSSPRIR